MEKRKFGNTGLYTTVLGYGGFHLLEIPQKETSYLLNNYLDNGGNYIETAEGYGNGDSEKKISQAVSNRREEFILVSKTANRTKKDYLKSLDGSLKRLKTDYLDVHIIHGLGINDKKSALKSDDINKIIAPDGALEGVDKAKRDGKIGFIGVSMHGHPKYLIEALNRYPFDAVMVTINYYDRFNYPQIEDVLIPMALEKNTAIILMKPLADGLLWKSPGQAFRYAMSQPVSVIVTGINSRKMLEDDLRYISEFKPMTPKEKEELYKNSEELGNYVCRQCDKCLPCPEQIKIPEIFECEGCYDRQMADGVIRNIADFALRERLRFWYDNIDIARQKYKQITKNTSYCTECGECLPRCPYGIDIIQKLKITHFKLTSKKTEDTQSLNI
jgi:uncharacterized protein